MSQLRVALYARVSTVNHARRARPRAGSGWRRHDDGPAILEAIVGGAKLLHDVLGVGPAGSVLTIEEREVPVRTVTAAMLEDLVVGMRG